MNTLSKNQSATDLVGDINANLQEMSSAVEVAVTDSANTLVGRLNTAFDDVGGAEELSISDNAADFISALNGNFDAASQGGQDIDAEMRDTLNKLEDVFNDGDVVFLVSTDLHHERPATAKFTYNGEEHDVDISHLKTVGNGQLKHADTLTPLINNQRQFIQLAEDKGIDVTAVLCLGDLIDGDREDTVENGVTVVTGQQKVKAYADLMMPKLLQLNKPLLIALGNHDDNVANGALGSPLNDQQMSEAFLQGYVDHDNPSSLVWETDKCDYYRDFGDLRFVVINCNIRDPQTTSSALSMVYSTQSINFLKSAVTDARLNNKKVVLLGHLYPTWSNDNRLWPDNFIHYLEDNDDVILALFCGHSHNDGMDSLCIPSIITTCNLNGNGSHPNDEKDLWDVVCLNQNDGVIYTIRYNGAPEVVFEGTTYVSSVDRIVHYEPILKTTGEIATIVASPKSGETLTFQVSTRSAYYTNGDIRHKAYDQVADYAEYSISGNVCTVTVNAQSSVRIQHILVYVKYYNNGIPTRNEYWFIKIPKSS